jgi:hypothetical protein
MWNYLHNDCSRSGGTLGTPQGRIMRWDGMGWDKGACQAHGILAVSSLGHQQSGQQYVCKVPTSKVPTRYHPLSLFAHVCALVWTAKYLTDMTAFLGAGMRKAESSGMLLCATKDGDCIDMAFGKSGLTSRVTGLYDQPCVRYLPAQLRRQCCCCPHFHARCCHSGRPGPLSVISRCIYLCGGEISPLFSSPWRNFARRD